MPSPTKWTIFPSNEETWNSMLDECSKAEKSIDLEQFIFYNDDFGNKLLEICAERAAKGVKVRFLWDAAGSFTFVGSALARELKQKGIDLIFWRTLVPGYFDLVDYRAWLWRNHRRTLVIDGKVGFTGSICLRDQMKNWRDINVKISGPIVSDMLNSFERMWARANKQRLPKRYVPPEKEFRYVTNYPQPGRRDVYKETVTAIKNARQYIYITTPYFVPTPRLNRAIAHAAKRGVDVRLILPESSDHTIIDLGARSFFNHLLKAGVRIFLYEGNMIHGKAIVIDDTWSSIGSMNLDQVSLLYNFEANIISTNRAFAEEVASHFVHDLQDSKEVHYKLWKKRTFIEKIPENLVKFIRPFL